MAWQPGAASTGAKATQRRKSSAKLDSDWHADGEAGPKKRNNSISTTPRHALAIKEDAEHLHAAQHHDGDSEAFTSMQRKAEKAMLYRMRFEGEYMKKKQREFDKHSKKEEEKRQMDANKAAVEERILRDRENAQEALRRKKMFEQNRVVERSLSSGLAAFKKVKQAQKEAKRYSDLNVLLSEQYSHLNYLVQQKTELIEEHETAARLKYMKERDAAKVPHHSKHKHKHKHWRNSALKAQAQAQASASARSGEAVPQATIQQREREVENFQHVVEHKLRNVGEIAEELAREHEAIDRLRRSFKQKKQDLTVAQLTKAETEERLEEQRQAYAHESRHCEIIEQTIAALKQQIEDDKSLFAKEWDDRMETLTDHHREATRHVEEIGGKSRNRAKSMSRRKLSHLATGRHSRLMGVDTSRNQHMVIKKERKAIKTMDEAFQAITRATGIDSLEELVDTFVHSDRRNFSVVKHITALDRDVDELTAELRDLKELRLRMENEQDRNGLSRKQKVSSIVLLLFVFVLFVFNRGKTYFFLSSSFAHHFPASLSFICQVTAMIRELEGLDRQISVSAASYDRDVRVVEEISPEIHDLFVQLDCRDPSVPAKYDRGFMTDRNLMRMLGLVDQQTALLMSIFAQLDHQMTGTTDNSTIVEQQRRMADAQHRRAKASQLSRKPEPPKMGDFDEGEDDDDDDEEEEDSDSTSSSSSSDSEDEEGLTMREKKRRAKRKADRKKEKKKRNVAFQMSGRSGRMEAASAIQKPEPISNLRKSVQRQIETGDHRHNHGSVHRFEPTRKDHFQKRTTAHVPQAAGMGLGVTPEQLAALHNTKTAQNMRVGARRGASHDLPTVNEK